jgi:hypothetical protein
MRRPDRAGAHGDAHTQWYRHHHQQEDQSENDQSVHADGESIAIGQIQKAGL